MKLAYQIATPEVKESWAVTAYQGPLEQSFKCLAEIGYDGAELMVAIPEQIDGTIIKSLSEKYALPIAMICTGEILGQEGLCFTLNDSKKRAQAIESVKAAIRLASELHCKYINVGRVRGGFSLNGNHTDERNLSVAGLKEISEYAHKYNVKVLLEPVNSIAATFINRTQEGIDLVNEINSPNFRLMLDSNHMYLDDPNMYDSLRMAKDYVEYVHLADSNRLYPGNCKLNFVKFLDVLYEQSYSSWVSVEVFQRPDQETAVAQSFKYLHPLIRRYE